MPDLHVLNGRRLAKHNLDRRLDRLTAPADKSDGIVQGTSQLYPNATRQCPSPKGDSHVGENYSNLRRNKLRKAFKPTFSVRAR